MVADAARYTVRLYRRGPALGQYGAAGGDRAVPRSTVSAAASAGTAGDTLRKAAG